MFRQTGPTEVDAIYSAHLDTDFICNCIKCFVPYYDDRISLAVPIITYMTTIDPTELVGGLVCALSFYVRETKDIA